MRSTKTKLIEINYRYEALQDLNELLRLRQVSNHLLQQLSEHFEITSYGFAMFICDETRNSIRYRIFNKRTSKLSLPFKQHEELKRLHPEFVLVHGISNYFQVMHLKLVLGRKCRILVQHHGERPTGIIKAVLLKLSALFVDAFLFTSEETARQLRIPQRKLFLLMEGSTDFKPKPQSQARIKLKLPEKELIYLWVGRLIPIKNPLFFLEEFTEFLKQQPSARLYVIYHEETLLEECRKISQGHDTIKYLGKVPHEELKEWYSAADYFVSASLHEGSGYALCEAMACGCVPIVPSIGAFQFMTANGACALMYESGSRKSLQEVLAKSWVLDKTEAQKKVLKQFNDQLSFEAIAESLFRITGALHKSNK
jgi:glycosyltransferase involved in cell wall biosynthesis